MFVSFFCDFAITVLFSDSAFEVNWWSPSLKPRPGAYCVFQHLERDSLLVAVDFSSDTRCLTWKSGRGGARVKFLSSFRVWEICPSGSFSWNHHTYIKSVNWQKLYIKFLPKWNIPSTTLFILQKNMVWGNCHKITTEVHSVRKHILVIFWRNGARASTNMRHLKHHTVLKILSKTYWACTLVTLKHAMFPHQNWSVITQHKIPSYLIIWLIGFLLL